MFLRSKQKVIKINGKRHILTHLRRYIAQLYRIAVFI